MCHDPACFSDLPKIDIRPTPILAPSLSTPSSVTSPPSASPIATITSNYLNKLNDTLDELHRNSTSFTIMPLQADDTASFKLENPLRTWGDSDNVCFIFRLVLCSPAICAWLLITKPEEKFQR
ncbi:hypothetical protein NDA11_007982 [Ustilago hordei]|uniref:Uncharacterized protein n=1 Tax=Ustilago hordei TaxID=120017 RepID=I2FQW4_USTHO|nr:uncharacterized protein UHO2_05125 [Ustilago hordei]KAJ1043015.1 hypothetical protein NDA10_007923 [Ustilago hordei]KAJ1596184.1 hypothetical protein NDA11_007982 [Ustilago hordei]KAJ1596693.1 hypothetical protein NDA14_004484 [Ustilago hordei]CCF49307.1 uncharacterized protein UHOR_07726 [Ustilago hordei]SYW79945.1 uncharacterized protein UHO2_05125 [Ustilago hordei]